MVGCYVINLSWFVCCYRVQLAVNEETNTAVAVKIIPLSSDTRRTEEVRKEVYGIFLHDVPSFILTSFLPNVAVVI